MSKRMRLLAGAIAVTGSLTCAKTYETHSVSWYHGAEGFPAAQAEQKKSGQPMLVFFHRPKCHACQFVDDAILSDLEVERAIADLVRVRINPEDDAETADLAKRFGVSTFPTMMLVSSPDGEHFRFRTSQLDPVATFLEDLLIGLVMLDVSRPTTSLDVTAPAMATALK